MIEENRIENYGDLKIKVPNEVNLDQDEEWFQVFYQGSWHKYRFHDYKEIYRIPKLYETIFHKALKCNSPTEVSRIFKEYLFEKNINIDTLRVLEIGAGNGVSGESLRSIGIQHIVGLDIIKEAQLAANRDRPSVYDNYFISDLRYPDSKLDSNVNKFSPNTLVTVSTLGYGDIPTKVFCRAFNLIETPGIIALNIKEEFIQNSKESDFSNLLNSMFEKKILQVEISNRYRHRLSNSGKDIFYVTIIGRKILNIPQSMIPAN